MNPEDLYAKSWRTAAEVVGTYIYHKDDYEPIKGNNPLKWAVDFNTAGEFAELAKQMNIEKLEAQFEAPIEKIGAPEDARRIGLVL